VRAVAGQEGEEKGRVRLREKGERFERAHATL
jgi:hypothetical protein